MGVKRIRAIFMWPCKMVSVICSLYVLSANGWKDQNMDSSFSRWRNPNMENALFDWPILLQYAVKANYRWISRKFFGHEVFSPERLLNQPKPTRVCIRSINQSNRSISVFCCFCFVRAFSFQGHTKIALTLTNCGYGFCPHKICLGFRRAFFHFSLS